MPILNMIAQGGGGGSNIGEPSNISATVVSNTSVEITWIDNNLQAIPPSTFQKSVLVRKVGSAPTSPIDGTTVVTETVMNTYQNSPFTDTGLTDGTTYYYQVFSYSADGGITYGTPASATPFGGWQPGANTMIYYEFDGNLNDSSGNNRNGTGGGTITYGTHYADLTNGYISIPQLTYSNPMTISFWLKKNSTANWIIDISSGSIMILRLAYDTDGESYFSYIDGPYSGGINLMQPTDTNWHLYQFVTDTNGCKFFWDTVEKGNASSWSTSYTSANNGAKIGTVWNGTSPNNPGLYAGYFIVENKAWTQQEREDYYNLTKGDYGIS